MENELQMAIIEQYPTSYGRRESAWVEGSFVTSRLRGRYQQRSEMRPDQTEPYIIVEVIDRGAANDFTEAMRQVNRKLQDEAAKLRQERRESERVKFVEPLVRNNTEKELRGEEYGLLQTKSYIPDNAAIRTAPKLDGLVRHLGYEPVSPSPEIQNLVLPTDVELVDDSQRRLRQLVVVPDSDLTPTQKSHLTLARTIAAGVLASNGQTARMGAIYAARIPPASDRVRTAGVYSKSDHNIYVHVDQLMSARSTVDTTIHELAHHVSGMEDAEKAHDDMISELAGGVVTAVAAKQFDSLIKAPDFQW